MKSAGMKLRPEMRVSKHRGRRVPVEYADAVEAWARTHGGHATLKWLDAPMNCWAVILRYRVGDPRQMIGEGNEADGEPVLLHEWKDIEWWRRQPPHVQQLAKRNHANRILPSYYAFDLDELGVEGVIARLNQGNILSGRGQFKSAEEAGNKQTEKFRAKQERERLRRRDEAGHRALDMRRSVYKIPFLGVGVQLTRATASSASAGAATTE